MLKYAFSVPKRSTGGMSFLYRHFDCTKLLESGPISLQNILVALKNAKEAIVELLKKIFILTQWLIKILFLRKILLWR